MRHYFKKQNFFLLLFLLIIPFNIARAAPETLFLVGFDGTYQDFSKNDSSYMIRSYQGPPFIDDRQEYVKFGTGSIRVFGDKDDLLSAIHFVPKQDIALDTDEFTIDLWVYPYVDLKTDNHVAGRYFQLLNTNKAQNALWPLIELLRNNTASDDIPTLAMSQEMSTTNANRDVQLQVPAIVPIEKGKWNHIAIQRKNTTTNSQFTVSVNGKMGNAVTKDKSFRLPISNRILFNYNDTLTGGFFGFFDEIKIVKGAALWGDVAPGGTFDISKIVSSITPEMKAKAKPLVKPYEIPQKNTDPSLLLSFDDSINDSKGSTNVTFSDPNLPKPVVVSDKVQVGKGSVSFNANKNALIYTPKGNELTFGSDDFTIDFWIYPRSLSTGSSGETVHIFSLKDASGKTFLMERANFPGGLKTPMFGPIADHPENNYTFGSYSIRNWLDLVPNQWNHVALQREGGSIRYIINGVTSLVANPVSFTGSAVLTIAGMTDKSNLKGKPYSFDGYIDNFRVTKAARWPGAIQGDHVIYGEGGVSVIPPTPDDLNANRAVVPGKEAVPLVSNQEKRETAEFGVIAPREVAHELLIKRPDGSRHYTNYYDASSVLISSIFWAENTGDKKIKTLEYDEKGELAHELHYGPDETVTDTFIYHSKDQGGGLYKEIRNRDGIETSSRYNERGKVVYSHQVKRGTYLYSKYFTYDDADRLTSDLKYYSATHFEKNTYLVDGGDIKEIKNYVRTSQVIDGADYVYTDSIYTKNKLSSTKKLYAQGESLNLQKVEMVTYDATGVRLISQRTFDYANNLQKYLTYITTAGNKALGGKEAEYVWKIDSGDFQYKTSYDHDVVTGALVTKTKVTGPGDITIYRKDGETIDNESVFTFFPNNTGWKDMTTKYYDKDGAILKKIVVTFYQDQPYVMELSSTYDGKDVLVGKTFYKNGVRDYTESNDSAGKVYFKTKYSTAVGGTEYTSSRYYVLGNQEILQSVTVHDASSGTLLREVSKDNLAKKKFGDAILASQGITLNDVNANTEKAKTLEILNKFLPQYKTALSASGLSAGQKYALYVDFSRSIVYSFWALEYKIWATDRTKQLSTDEEFTYNSAVAWTGVDAQSSKEFWGIYINPAGVSRHSPDSAFVDMDINNPQIVDAVISAGSFDSLKNITKKKEKWDSVFTGPSFVFDTTSNKTLYYYNMAANGGTGAYLNLAQLTAADPTVNLILDRMQEDLGMSLNSSLSEEDIVKQFYTYFYKQSIFQYLYDFGDTVQTVNQTLVRGGGDCEDFGTFAASLLKNLFIRLGKQDAANRVGLGMAVVDVTNKISTTNQGIGHASLMFKSVQGKYYWIESAYLFMGNAAKLDQSTILAPLDNTKIGGSGAMTTKVKIVPDGWYVEVQAFSPVNGKAEGFTTSLGGISMQIQTPTLIGTSATEKISTLPTYIEPYNKKVNALADSMLRYIPRIAEQTPTYIAEYVNTFVKIHSNYKTDTGGDNWARVGETLGAVVDKNGALLASIQGDCEDLGFVEASLLQNMLTKYYVARGMALTGAILKAQGNVMVVAQNNYGGVANKTHLLVALVDLSIISNNLTTVVLMDPQVGGMTEVMPFSSLFKGDYIFFASSRKVSAISYYDWNNLNLSSAAGSSLGSIDSIVEEMIEPVEPGYELFSDSETAAAVRAVEGKIDAGELPEFLSKTDTSILKDALSEPYTPEEMARDATIFKNDVANAENSIGKTDKAAEKKVAEISNKTELSLVEAEQGIVASLEQQAQQAVRDANFGAVPKGDSFNDMLSAVTDSSQVKQKTLDAQLQNVSELAGQGLVSKNTIELVGQNIDSSANALNVVAKVNSASNLLAAPTNTSFADYGAFFDMLNNPDTFSNSKNLGKMGNDISSFISNVAAISPSGAGKLPPSYSTTFSPSGIQTYFGEGPSLTSRIEHPNILYMPIRGMLQCVATTPLCQSLPTGTIVKTKPDNSYFAGSGKCSSTTYSCDDTTYNTGWFCNPGFILSGGRCIPIEPPVVVATSTLTVTISGTGSGVATSTPVGINCTRASGITAGTCSISFNKNSLITLTASSTSDSLFTGWSGGGCSGTGVCSVTMDVSKIVDAQFTLKIVGPVRPDLMPNDVPDITGPSNSTWIDSNVTPGVTYFIPGTILTLKAQPKNSGPGVVPSVLWNVKFQAKLSNQALTQYIDLPNIASVPVAIGA
ncbi:MAG: LamG domain-containing protein, partial [Candidatus Taylorbacteria bacterium]|nr:LamG domain-containing protein [Candidatus Taylorbacteria bacterium]